MAGYTTIQGDMWDTIALKVYGSEAHAGYLMANNWPLLDHFVFPAGVEVSTPDLPEEGDTIQPVWRTAAETGDPYA